MDQIKNLQRKMRPVELKLFYADKVNPGFWALFEGKELKKGYIVKDEHNKLYRIQVNCKK